MPNSKPNVKTCFSRSTSILLAWICFWFCITNWSFHLCGSENLFPMWVHLVERATNEFVCSTLVFPQTIFLFHGNTQAESDEIFDKNEKNIEWKIWLWTFAKEWHVLAWWCLKLWVLNWSHTWFSEKNTTAVKVFRDSWNKFQLCLCLVNLDVITSTVSEPEVFAIFQFRFGPDVKWNLWVRTCIICNAYLHVVAS